MTAEDKVRMLLAMIPYYQERQYSGNYYDNDDLNDIRDAIARAALTDRQREIIQLTFIQDMTFDVAGRVLGIGKSTIKYHEARAVTRITEEYEKGRQHELN